MFIVENVIGSLFWGVVIALVATALIFLVCMVVRRRIVQTPVSLLVIGIYFVYAAVIGSLIAGGYYAKGYVEEMGEYLADITNKSSDMSFSMVDFNELKDMVGEEFKISKPILDRLDANDLIKHANIGEPISDYLVNEANDTIDDYIDNCLMWLLVGTIIAFILAAAVSRNNHGRTSVATDVNHYGFDNDTSSAGYY